jgi:hypothetical protein
MVSKKPAGRREMVAAYSKTYCHKQPLQVQQYKNGVEKAIPSQIR